MILSTIVTILSCLALGFLANIAQGLLGTNYLHKFLYENLIVLLVALLAINSATMGIVLTKLRDLISLGNGEETFSESRRQMLHSIHEQICLIIFGVIFLVLKNSNYVEGIGGVKQTIDAGINGIFFYALWILYDTAKGVLIIVDYDSENGS